MKDENPGWDYKPEGDPKAAAERAPAAGRDDQEQQATGQPVVSWTASEFIDHNQGTGWYAGLAVATIGLTAGVYFLTHDYFASGTFPVLGVLVGIFARHKPRQVKYEITTAGVQAGEKFYSFRAFKSFSVIRDGALVSLSLLPVKKFMPAISAYFDPSDQEEIVGALSDKLPYEERSLDTVDRLTRRLKF